VKPVVVSTKAAVAPENLSPNMHSPNLHSPGLHPPEEVDRGQQQLPQVVSLRLSQRKGRKGGKRRKRTAFHQEMKRMKTNQTNCLKKKTAVHSQSRIVQEQRFGELRTVMGILHTVLTPDGQKQEWEVSERLTQLKGGREGPWRITDVDDCFINF
jgi:hypothetical protein